MLNDVRPLKFVWVKNERYGHLYHAIPVVLKEKDHSLQLGKDNEVQAACGLLAWPNVMYGSPFIAADTPPEDQCCKKCWEKGER